MATDLSHRPTNGKYRVGGVGAFSDRADGSGESATLVMDPISSRANDEFVLDSDPDFNAAPDDRDRSLNVEVVAQPRPAKVKKPPSFSRDLIEMSKPRIVTMILVTTAASAWIAIASHSFAGLSLLRWALLLVGTGLVAGSAGAANQVWERVIDTLMPRTASRPMASGRMSFALGVFLTASAGIIGTAMLALFFGTVPAIVGAATWAVYVLIYTPMKVRTSWNTTVGAIAGALPVFIGYTAAGGHLDELAGWTLFGVLMAWQYPHFMAIAWLYRRQYGEAGFHMTTTIEPTGRNAAWQSIIGTVALAASGVTLCLAPMGELSITFASVATSAFVILACYPLMKAALRFQSSRDDARARKMLRWSLVVLPAVLLVMTLRMIGLS